MRKFLFLVPVLLGLGILVAGTSIYCHATLPMKFFDKVGDAVVKKYGTATGDLVLEISGRLEKGEADGKITKKEICDDLQNLLAPFQTRL